MHNLLLLEGTVHVMQ